jgi:hypothetical protein
MVVGRHHPYILPFRYPHLLLQPPGKPTAPEDERTPLREEDFSSEAVSFLVTSLSLKEVAEAMPNKALGARIVAEVDSAISAFIDDDICPRWPKPGPPPPWALVSQVAAELNFVANTLPSGNLRTSLVQVGGRILQSFAENELGG